ncbi:MAG: hypothetical protein H6Q89_1751 [Myxococcaceae bacterium]|nr:hypothetical protein [Myxococcaceae bacterium]
MTESHLQDITRTIQLAVAPVFLLTAIAGILNVLSQRLGRVIDRARLVEGLAFNQVEDARRVSIAELRLLSRRARLIHTAFVGTTGAALLVCLLIAVAFLGYLFGFDFGIPMAVLFVLALAAIVIALLFFLREIFIAVATLQFGLPPEAKEPVVKIG